MKILRNNESRLKNLRLIIVLFIAIILSFEFFSSEFLLKFGGADGSAADVWYAPGTQKIRPEVDAENYSEIRKDVLEVKLGKAEYESAQIIMSAKRDIDSYDLVTSDLKMVDNENVSFPAENIEVFNQRYIDVTTVKENHPDASVGMYPDALVPLQASKKYHEDKVKNGENQGIWVTFHASVNQPAGVYGGTFTLKIDGAEQSVPVRVTVWDMDFAKSYTAQNCFLINWSSFSYAELDSSQDIYTAYAEALLDYRLQAGLLINDFNPSDPEDIAYYTDIAFEYASDPRCTVVFMPFDIIYDRKVNDTALNVDTQKKYIRSFVDKSINSFDAETGTGLNLVAKTMTYFTFIDEPQMFGLEERTQRTMRTFKQLRTDVYEEYKSQLEEEENRILKKRADGKNVDDELALLNWKKEVVESIPNIHNVVTGPELESLSEVEIYCPKIDSYGSEGSRALYADNIARWVYTCVDPKYPYPTYHIDDLNLLSARLLGWMQADFDIVGNLYWAANLYNAYSWEDFLEDPYMTAQRYNGANGDGFLFYPGKKYGVDGPLGSIRLQAIRDGVEDYEILQAIEAIYDNIGNAVGEEVDFSRIYSYLSENLYIGTAVYTTQEFFEDVREMVANLGVLANMGGAVSSLDLTGGVARMEVILPLNLTLKVSGTVQRGTELQNGYVKYNLKKSLGETGNRFELEIVGAEKSVTLSFDFGGQTKAVDAAQFAQDASIRSGTISDVYYPVSQDALVDASAVIAGGSGKILRFDLPEVNSTLRQTVLYSGKTLNDMIGKNTKKLVLKIYNDGAEYDFSMQFRYENSNTFTEIRSGTLKPGMNEITISGIYGYSWDKTGALTDIRFYFGAPSAAARSDIYFVGADVYFV